MKPVGTGLLRHAGIAGLLAGALLSASPLLAAEGRWLVDRASGCGTTSAFNTPGESIRWYGDCRDGKLHGRGTLVWYSGQTETERNEGTFRRGEFHGDVLTTFPDGRAVYGQYWTGVRHGYFLVIQPGHAAIQATYEKGKLKSRRQLSAAEARDWQLRRQQQMAAVPRPTPARQAAATPRPASQDARPARTAAAQPAATPERPGFWSRINPLNWGVVGFFSDLFDTGPDQPDEARTASVARAPQRQPATAPAPLRAAAVRPATPAAPPRARAPMVQPAVYRPAAPAAGVGIVGTGYDMSALLDEPHPFAKIQTPVPSATPGTQTAFQPVPTAAAPQPRTSWYPPQPAAAPTSAAAPRVLPEQAASDLFLRGYELESAGNLTGAATVYQQAMQYYPATRAAGLARARLNLVRTTVAATSLPAAGPSAPRAARARPPAGGQIVAANTPFPQAAAGANLTESRALSMFTNSPWLQQNVCTRKGLYSGGTKWCGRVLRDDGSHLLVEVEDVRLHGFGTIGISRSTCTGGTLLTWFSRGTTIRVPKQCLTATAG